MSPSWKYSSVLFVLFFYWINSSECLVCYSCSEMSDSSPCERMRGHVWIVDCGQEIQTCSIYRVESKKTGKVVIFRRSCNNRGLSFDGEDSAHIYHMRACANDKCNSGKGNETLDSDFVDYHDELVTGSTRPPYNFRRSSSSRSFIRHSLLVTAIFFSLLFSENY